MAKIYLVRHQAAGLLWQFPFAAEPSDSQKAALKSFCDGLHGTSHPKTHEPYWVQVTEVDLLDGSTLPDVATATDGAGKDNVASVPQFKVFGVGHVSK